MLLISVRMYYFSPPQVVPIIVRFSQMKLICWMVLGARSPWASHWMHSPDLMLMGNWMVRLVPSRRASVTMPPFKLASPGDVAQWGRLFSPANQGSWSDVQVVRTAGSSSIDLKRFIIQNRVSRDSVREYLEARVGTKISEICIPSHLGHISGDGGGQGFSGVCASGDVVVSTPTIPATPRKSRSNAKNRFLRGIADFNHVPKARVIRVKKARECAGRKHGSIAIENGSGDVMVTAKSGGGSASFDYHDQHRALSTRAQQHQIQAAQSEVVSTRFQRMKSWPVGPHAQASRGSMLSEGRWQACPNCFSTGVVRAISSSRCLNVYCVYPGCGMAFCCVCGRPEEICDSRCEFPTGCPEAAPPSEDDPEVQQIMKELQWMDDDH